MTKKLAEKMNRIMENKDLTKQNPLWTEISEKGENGICDDCLERENHENKNLCIDKRLLVNMSAYFLHGHIDEQLFNTQHGIVIGVRDGTLEYSPWGQFRFLNLGFRGWNPLFPTGYDKNLPIVVRESGHHQLVREEDNFFHHIRLVVEKLPSDYGKPILVEQFLMRHALENTEEREEMIECQIEAYYEHLDKIRTEFPFLYVIVGPVLAIRNRPQTEESYEICALKLKKVSYMMAAYAIKYGFPFVHTQGTITALPMKVNKTIWYTKTSDYYSEPIKTWDHQYKRYYFKKLGKLCDLIAESHQQVLATLANAIADETRHGAWGNQTNETEPPKTTQKRTKGLKLYISKKPRTEPYGKLIFALITLIKNLRLKILDICKLTCQYK
jgi:hypothetical protein